MSENSAASDESRSELWQIEQAVLKGVSVGGNLTLGNVNQTTHVHLPPLLKTEPKHFTVPYARNAYFTGREEILTQLHETLGQSGAAALSQAKAIAGLGGVGKTQTAVEYAYRYFQQESGYDWVLWVNASNLTLASSFGALATDLALPNHQENKLDENIAAVRHWLGTTDRWLLIFDNVDDPQAVKPFRPQNPKGRILITSRVQRLETLGVAGAIALDMMTKAEAEEFLQRRTERNPIAPSEHQSIAALAKTLGYLPLALEQAAAYILAKGIGFGAYLRSYEKRRLQLLEKEKPQTGDYPESVATTWAINFEAVQTSSEAAADLLRVSAFLAPDNIPYEILLLGKDQLGAALGAALAETADDELVIPELLEELTRYSLIRLETADRYSIHRMVQEVLRDVLAAQRQQWIDRTVAALNETFPNPEFENWWRCDRLIEHVLAIDLQQATQTIELGRLLNQAGCFLDNQGRYIEAESIYLEALQLRKIVLGEQHTDTSTSLNNLAWLYYSQGRYEEAVPLYSEALETKRILFGDTHPDVASILNNLGLLYEAQGQYEQAELLLQQALEISIFSLGEEHPDVAQSLNNLAALYESQGRYEKAELSYLKALEMRRILLGEDHPDIVESLNNLADLYRTQGRLEESEILFLKVLQLGKYLWGENHPRIASSLNNLALVYFSQKLYSKAEKCYLQALKMNKALLGKIHPNIATCLNNLATLYKKQDRYEEAKLLYQQAIEMQRSLLREEHPSMASCLNNLAKLHSYLKEYKEAELVYLKALIIVEKLGENHPTTQKVRENFRYLLQQAIESDRAAELSGHPLTQDLLKQLSSQSG